MSVRGKWKTFGKSTGNAFSNFGKAMATTAKVVVGTEERVDEDGKSNLKKSWSAAGKGFGKAGSSLGKAAAATAKKVVGKEDDATEETVVGEAEVVEEREAVNEGAPEESEIPALECGKESEE